MRKILILLFSLIPQLFFHSQHFDIQRDHVKYIVEAASENKLRMGILPYGGEFVTPACRERIESVSEEVYEYVWFGYCFKEYNENIVCILDVDRLPKEKPKGADIWRKMPEGIADAVYF